MAAKELSITTGILKGTKLSSPYLDSTHPMSSRAKNALFNSLSSFYSQKSLGLSASSSPNSASTNPKLTLSNLTVLDAYAGSGALGFEAISSGAKSVVFIENHPLATKTILVNIDKINKICYNNKSYYQKLPKITLFNQSVQKFQDSTLFDLIFIDPPYQFFHPGQFLHLAKNLKPNGILVISHPASIEFTAFGKLKHLKTLNASFVQLDLFSSY